MLHVWRCELYEALFRVIVGHAWRKDVESVKPVSRNEPEGFCVIKT
jgi:hypothetical protein